MPLYQSPENWPNAASDATLVVYAKGASPWQYWLHDPSFSTSSRSRPSISLATRFRLGTPRFGLIWINPDRVSGAPCFYGTRVPIKNLFDSLAAGESLEDFLDGFEGVTREQALAVLELAGKNFLDDLKQS